MGHKKLKDTLIQCWETVHRRLLDLAKLPVDCAQEFIRAYKAGYILDIGIIEKDDGELDCTVIELNPFQRTTGAALFTWNEVDIIIENGHNQDPELRFLRHPRENIGQLMSEVILPALDTKEDPYDFYYPKCKNEPNKIRWFGWFLSFFRNGTIREG